ncbi:MAG: hypothetical protein OIF34_07075, partial [Porticoccaceae bacterium]|nr:hypothetical protein [Porticoccaceae bacterium]
MEIYQSPFCSLTLARSPQRKRETLRAWDAADEYLLNFTVDKQLVHANSRIVLLNDSFGALAVTLCTAYPSLRPVSIGDSWLSQRGTEHNLQLNRLAEDSVELRDTLNWPAHDAIFDVALIKIPKSLSLLEDQLHRLRS